MIAGVQTEYLSVYALYDANNRHPFPIYRRPAGITDTVLLDKPISPDQLSHDDILYLELSITQRHERLLGIYSLESGNCWPVLRRRFTVEAALPVLSQQPIG